MHRALDEAGPPPEAWIIGRVCEEFGCLPSDAARELMTEDAELVLTIIEMRAYAQAKSMVKDSKDKTDLPRTELVKLVLEIQREVNQEKRRKGV